MAKKIKGRPRSADPCGTTSIRTPAVEIRHAAGYLAYILCNWVKYDAKLVRSHNERIRSAAICKAMKQKHGLTFSEGKENVKIEKLHRPDKVKYTVYEAVKTVLEGCTSLTELAERLTGKEIVTVFVHRGGDPQKEIQGITFTKDNLTFKASKIDRKFSYGNLCKSIEANRMEAKAAVLQAEKQRRREQFDERKQQRRREAAQLRREERAQQKEIAFQKIWREFIGEEIGRGPDADTSRQIEREPAAVARQDERIRRAGEERAGRNAANECPERTVSRSPAVSQKKSNGIRPAMPTNESATERSCERIDEIRGRRLSP